MPPLLELDGAFGEGGGQILRTSLALSLLTGQGFHLANVRAGRAKSGLQPQHLRSVLAATAIGQAQTRGASLGSSDLVFEPGEVRAGNHRFDIGTAGATGLVLHTIYLPLALRGGEPADLTLTGGTHVRTSPTFSFLDATWRAYLGLMGLDISLRLDRPGFYPRGGGVVSAYIQPCSTLRGITLPDRPPARITGVSAVASLDAAIGRRQARQVARRLVEHGLECDLVEETWAGGPCTAVVLRVENDPVPATFVSLGERGKPAERVADQAVDELLAYLDSGAFVDEHSADQIVLPLALAEGPSEYTAQRISLHLTTNIAVIRWFIDRTIECHTADGPIDLAEPGAYDVPGRVVVR
jgi:RNA 3'-terminal phosphate cyclase (ATP)